MSSSHSVDSPSLTWRLLRGLTVALAWTARPSLGVGASPAPWEADAYLRNRDALPAAQTSGRRGLRDSAMPAPACTHDRVALLMLSMGQFDQAAAWEPWFEQAGELVPLAEPRTAGCDRTQLSTAVTRQRRGQRDSAHLDAIARQSLFTVQVHVPADRDFDTRALWGPYVIEERLDTRWGDYSLVDATRALMRVAFANPCNKRFVLFSEDSVPLYPPAVLHQVSLNSQLSRINACHSSSGSSAERWQALMAEDPTAPVSTAAWRKSSQWWDLRRDHVAALLQDQAVDHVFRLNCNGLVGDAPCIGDEHYFATALAMLGKSQETDCVGTPMATDWDPTSWHPRAYRPREVNGGLLSDLRQGAPCASELATSLAAYRFASIHQSIDQAQLLCKLDVPWSPLLLDASCPTLARKFPTGTAPNMASLLRRELRQHHTQNMNMLLPKRLPELKRNINAFERAQERFLPLPADCVASRPVRDGARGMRMDFACPPSMPVERTRFEALRCYPKQQTCETELVDRADMTQLDEAFERTLNGVEGLREGIAYLRMLLRSPRDPQFANVGRRIADLLRHDSTTLANFCTEADALSAEELSVLVSALWLRAEEPIASKAPYAQMATALQRMIPNRAAMLQMLVALAGSPSIVLPIADPTMARARTQAQVATAALRLLGDARVGDLQEAPQPHAPAWQDATVAQVVEQAGGHLAVALREATKNDSLDAYTFTGAVMAYAQQRGHQHVVHALQQKLAEVVASDTTSTAPLMLRHDLARLCDLVALLGGASEG